MKFFIKDGNGLNYGSEFVREECSLTTYGEQGDCSLLIDNTHLTLDFDIRTNKVIGISGFLGDLNHMERKEITIPSYSIASLFVDSEIEFQPGIGYRMGMKAKASFDSRINGLSCWKILHVPVSMGVVTWFRKICMCPYLTMQ